MSQRFMIEKSKDTRRILTTSLEGIEATPTLVHENKYGILYEIARATPAEYQTLMDRLVAWYN